VYVHARNLLSFFDEYSDLFFRYLFFFVVFPLPLRDRHAAGIRHIGGATDRKFTKEDRMHPASVRCSPPLP
jgi:hypothetical protein